MESEMPDEYEIVCPGCGSGLMGAELYEFNETHEDDGRSSCPVCFETFPNEDFHEFGA